MMMMWIKIKMAAGILVAVFVVSGGAGMFSLDLVAQDNAGGKKAAGRTEYPLVPKVAEGPVLDGDLIDQVWKEALKAELGFADSNKKGEPENSTTVYVVTDDKNLYFGFDCVEKHPDGPFVIREPKPPFPKEKRRDVRIPDHVRVQLSFGRWGKYEFYTFHAHPPFGRSLKGWMSCYFGAPSEARASGYRCFINYYKTAPDKIPSYLAKGKAVKGRWTAEIRVALKDLVLYPEDGLPDLAEMNFYRIRMGNDRDKDNFNKMIVYDEGPAYWKNFYDYVQSWKRMPGPNRFRQNSPKTVVWNNPQPLWFNLVKLKAGTTKTKTASNMNALPGNYFSMKVHYKAFNYTKEEGSITRLERWEDSVPKRPEWKEPAPMIQTQPVQKGRTASFLKKPTVAFTAKGAEISFSVKEPIDVAVGIVDEAGKVIRHLAAGVLGKNPPRPLTANSLSQKLIWDKKDDNGEPVASGKYKAVVSLGLTPMFAFVFKEQPNYTTKGKCARRGVSQSHIASGLGLENLEPIKRSFHWPGGAVQQILVDRKTEELYFGGYLIYDGKTGKYLREAKLSRRLPCQGTEYSYGELIIGPDENWWINGWVEVWRFNRQGREIPFKVYDRPFIPQVRLGHNNPGRGHCFGGPENDYYVVHHYTPHGNQNGVISQYKSNGRVKQWGLVECCLPTQGVKVDRVGNIYMVCTIRPKSMAVPADFKPNISTLTKSFYGNFYGSVIKFHPSGGKVFQSKDGVHIATTNNYTGANLKKLYTFPVKVVGAKWIHPWMSPMTARSGAIKCNCEGGRFDLDPYERLWIPDAVKSRIEITDSNANTILMFGQHGNPKDSRENEIRFGFPSVISVSDHGAYVGDFFHRRAVKVKLDYSAREEADIQIR